MLITGFLYHLDRLPMARNQNMFIAFEGIDGSGKSTQVQRLADKLEQEGHQVHTTFEPTDSPIGSIIQNIMKGRIDADHQTIAALFAADRLDHLKNKADGILKKLEAGYTVITDRYYFSSYAYHGAHMPLDWVIKANQLSADLLMPDLNIFIDIDPEVSIQRINSDRSSVELYEKVETLQKVRDKYFEAIEKLNHKENVFVTDGHQAEEDVAEDIWQQIVEVMKSLEGNDQFRDHF